ncbi:MAG: Crp/Fnr family transcriptional regulator [Alphaproteobacteria bacterium]|nr:Crp/Fnr family transcriptional regulator [Alphaproteobacteria bacterium]
MLGSTYEEKRQIFAKNLMLGKLSETEIDALVRYARVEFYPANEEIFAKDSPGNSLFLVLRGNVRVSSISLNGKEIVLNIINEGELLGEIGVLDGGPRTGDAFAMTDCELLVLNRRDFMPYLEKHPEICLMLIKILCERLRRTSEQVEDLVFRHVKGRIAKALLQLSRRSGRSQVSSGLLELHLSQSELGNIVGSTRESVNKQLTEWEEQGIVAIAKELIIIREAAKLEQMV